MAAQERKIPAPEANPETRPFWEAAAAGRLLIGRSVELDGREIRDPARFRRIAAHHRTPMMSRAEDSTSTASQPAKTKPSTPARSYSS